MTTPTVPTIHLNGSSPGSLLGALDASIIAARQLELAIEECAPNDRDYYVQGPGVGDRARNEHRARLAAVIDLRRQLVEIRDAIQDQVEAREASR